MERLAQLEAKMLALVKKRDGRVCAAQQEILAANKEFDRQAIKLGRQINRLKGQQEKAAVKAVAKPIKPPCTDGLTTEEAAHYIELLERKQR